MIKMKREEKLEEQLRKCRISLHIEKQKNRALHLKGEKYKLQSKALAQKLKEAEAIKKNGMSQVNPNNL